MLTTSLLGHMWLAVLVITATTSVWRAADACSTYKTETRIKLDKNGYTNLIVGIEEGVRESQQLIEDIKRVFTDASEFLFKITKKRVYFKQIIILIPNTWRLDHYFDDFNTNSFDGRLPNTTWESYDRADFCIEERDDFTIDIPFVVNYAAVCGETASHINLTPDYLTHRSRAEKLYGPYANVLVHQWASFRYGVFSEYPHKLAEHNEEFYINSRGEIEATRCGLSLGGSLKNPTVANQRCDEFAADGLPSPNCIFEDDREAPDANVKSGSLMYRYFLEQLNEFCDNKTDNLNTLHNKLAPTVQNKECNGQSIWEVLRSHPDFRDYNNMPNMHIKSTVPKFQLLKRRYRQVVLLVDTAIHSKQPPSTFIAVVKAINDYVKLMLNDHDMVGIIHFDNNAKVTLPMTVVRDTANRNRIAQAAVPTPSSGKRSNIWNAISLGLTLLRSLDPNDKTTPTGGNLVLITSSTADTHYPNIELIIEQIKANEVNLNLVRIAHKQDVTLEQVVRETDGLNYLLSDYNKLVEVDDALINIANFETKNSEQVVELVNSFFEIGAEANKSGHVFVDKSVGSRANAFLRLKFNIRQVKEYVELVVHEPNGKKHLSKYNVKCKDSSLFSHEVWSLDEQEIVCEFKRPRYGKWTFDVVNKAQHHQIYGHLKANVFFNHVEDETSYYSNYYDRDEEARRKKRRSRSGTSHHHVKRHRRAARAASPPQPLANTYSSIRLETRWSKMVIAYPQKQTLYASLARGYKPILNATVKATIYRPTGDYVTLELRDDGLHADRFRDDGIYSRYFSSYVGNGVYYARIDVKTGATSRVNMQKLVGSPHLEHYPTIGMINGVNMDAHLSPIDEISRTALVGSFQLTDFSAEDLVRPSKIKDFFIKSIDLTNKLVNFTFTAPGDDGELGSAALYEIKCSYDPNELLEADNENERVVVTSGSAILWNSTSSSYAGAGAVFGFAKIANDVVAVSSSTKSSNANTHDYDGSGGDSESESESGGGSSGSTTLLNVEIVSSSFDPVENRPNHGGFAEFFVLSVDAYEHETFSIKLRAIDANGNCGPWSWPLTVKLQPGITLAPHLRPFVVVEASMSPAASGLASNDTTSAAQSQMVEMSKLSGKDASAGITPKERYFSRFFLTFLAILALILIFQAALILVLTVLRMIDSHRAAPKPIRV